MIDGVKFRRPTDTAHLAWRAYKSAQVDLMADPARGGACFLESGCTGSTQLVVPVRRLFSNALGNCGKVQGYVIIEFQSLPVGIGYLHRANLSSR